MKIVLNDLQDVQDLVAMLSPELLRRCNKGLSRVAVAEVSSNLGEDEGCDHHGVPHVCISATPTPARHVERESAKEAAELPDGLPTDIDPPTDPLPSDGHASTDHDADGVQHNTDWHSDPAKLNADGRWRARRKRDEVAYAEWLKDMRAEPSHVDDEPTATETHALPMHSPDSEMDAALSEDAAKLAAPGADPDPTLADLEEPQAPTSTINLEALVSDSLEAAQDASDSHIDLLNACRDFTSKHGHPVFTALKAAVAPDKATGQGKAVQQFTPEERRLMQACIANYPA
ncbi:hypothetical protein ABVD92_19935 [Xanthomonas euvesicatoria]